MSVANRYETMPGQRDPGSFLPLTPLDYQVLTILSSRQLHGYGIVHASGEAFPGQPTLDLGSLYRIISRMLGDRLLKEVNPPADSPSDKRVRRYYAVTDLGRAVARAEAARLRALLASPATLTLLDSRR
jgi:DNA-binding PadR family transcriptional regulator